MSTPLIEHIRESIKQEIKTLYDAIEVIKYHDSSSDSVKYLELIIRRLSKKLDYDILTHIRLNQL